MTNHIQTIEITARYLRFPIGYRTDTKKIKIYRDNQLVADLDLRFDVRDVSEYVYYDVSQYRGEWLQIVLPDNIDCATIQCDERIYRSSCERPAIHFTAPFGWINDPNGMIEYTSSVTGEKTYHMFYQHNPYDTIWGNMHWGHATSRDLLHWEHQPLALCPDAMGTMFSGCAILDRDNRSGLREGAEDVILFYYTAAGNTSALSEGKPFTQCLAYSTDGGKTLRKYEGNPILPHIQGDNRDPKVIWCDELSCYVMALYLDGNEYVLHRSEDLIHWAFLQKLTFPGETECPDFYPLNADDDPAKRKWVISGASHRYMIGEWREGQFHVVQGARSLHYGPYSYASQTLSDVSDGRRINVAWHRGIPYPEKAECNGQMSVPIEMTLKTDGSEYRLCANPITELSGILHKISEHSDLLLQRGNPFSLPLKTNAYEVVWDLTNIGDCVMRIQIFGNELIVNPKANQMSMGDNAAPLSLSDRPTKLRAIVDRYSMELFAGDGEIMMTVPITLHDGDSCLLMDVDGDTRIAYFAMFEHRE